jgi:hypothetical protein
LALARHDSGDPDSQFPLTFPDEEKAFVQQTYAQATTILEYGSGGSTMLAAKLRKSCVSVESDLAWTEALNAAITNISDDKPTAQALHIDMGPTGRWGFPQDSEKWTRYWRYPMQVWDRRGLVAPDVVLIDGRMRKACFAAVLMNVTQDTLVLFDDYADRKKYHRVERFIAPDRCVGRMAVFSVKPGMMKPADFRVVIPWFSELF